MDADSFTSFRNLTYEYRAIQSLAVFTQVTFIEWSFDVSHAWELMILPRDTHARFILYHHVDNLKIDHLKISLKLRATLVIRFSKVE